MSVYGDPSSVLTDDTNLLGVIGEQDESTGNNLTYNRIYTGRALHVNGICAASEDLKPTQKIRMKKKGRRRSTHKQPKQARFNLSSLN